MAKWLRRSTREAEGWDEIVRRFCQMLEDGRHIFDAAANSYVGGTNPETIRRDLFATDKRINATEQQIRRMIVVHGSVHGSTAFPSLLLMMSLAKDAERIGDYAKNIFDLAAIRPELPEGEHEELVRLKDRVSRLLVKGRNVFEAEDTEAARDLLGETSRVEDECDAGMDRMVRLRGTNAAGAALGYRYFKRVTSHLGNVATSLVVPLDKLDFFDE